MKKILCVAVSILSITILTSCRAKTPEKESDVFKPSLDTETECKIKIVGKYDNFEALEDEFERFNEYYPNVELKYSKLDDYENNIITTLDGEEKPNIFFSYTWMTSDEKYNPVLAHMDKLSDPALKINLDCIRPGLVKRDANNDIYMVPVFSRTYGTLVNNDLLKKEGVSVPKTWSELLSTCDALVEKGYKSPMMGYTLKSSSCLMNTIAYPSFVAELAKNPTALQQANDLDPAAGEYMRGSLEKVQQLINSSAIDLTECDAIQDNYDKVLLRFLDGDVPMMICAGDTVSGTTKRVKQYSPYLESPFDFSFYPIPMTEQGGYFIDSPSIEFSINKECNDLEMTREFMRFLIRDEELNNMASLKGLVTPTKNFSLDSIYAPFGDVPADRIYSPEELGVKDPLAVQIRVAAYKVGRGELTIDEAVDQYGTFKA